MEIEINKYDNHVQIVVDGYKGVFDTYRLVSEMTKDLVKAERKVRAIQKLVEEYPNVCIEDIKMLVWMYGI